MTRALVVVFAVATAPLTCSRLPAEWRDASGVAAFAQSPCIGTIVELEHGRSERAEVRGGDGRLLVAYRDAHFRCDQRVTAYSKQSDRRVQILVQPSNMDPATVAKCDCLYDIRFEVRNLQPGIYEVTLYRRWDNRHVPNPPVEIASERAAVE